MNSLTDLREVVAATSENCAMVGERNRSYPLLLTRCGHVLNT
jgi:hypothetical protein